MFTNVETTIARRRAPGLALADAAEQVAYACHDMAARFHRGGTLMAFGTGPDALDAAHLVMDFLHPASISRRGLPALSLAPDPAAAGDGASDIAGQLRLRGGPDDIAVAVATGPPSPQAHVALTTARELGMLTVALTVGPAPADHLLAVRTDDPLVASEIHVTAYHLLSELVHEFLERGIR